MENKKGLPLDYELAKQKLREQFGTGKSLLSKGGAFAPLLQEMLKTPCWKVRWMLILMGKNEALAMAETAKLLRDFSRYN